MSELMGVEEASVNGPAPPGRTGFAFVFAGEIGFPALAELERTPLEEDFFLELSRSLLASSARLLTAVEVEGLGGVIASSAGTFSGTPLLERS